MTKTEKIEAEIAKLAGDRGDVGGLLEDLRAAVRAEMRRDLLADLRDPRMALTTVTEAVDFIKSNY